MYEPRKVIYKSFFFPKYDKDRYAIVEFGSRTAWGTFESIRDLLLGRLLRLKQGRVYAVAQARNISYETVLKKLETSGFVKGSWFKETFHDYPRFISYVVEFVNKTPNSEKHFASSMVLPHESPDVAISKALGEALERDAALLPEPGSRFFPTVYKRTPQCAMETYPRFTQAQYATAFWYANHSDASAQYACVKAYNATAERNEYIPLQSVYYGHGLVSGEPLLQPTTTSGCGGGFTRVAASLSAMYELIERDHFFLYWYSQKKPKHIDSEILPEPFQSLIQKDSKKYNIEVFFLDTSYDLSVASCVCIIIDPVLNCMAMGGKAGSHRGIYESAYCEALTVLSYVRERRNQPNESGATFFEYGTPFTHRSITKKVREQLCCTPEAIAWVREHFLSGTPIKLNQVQHRFREFKSQEDEYMFLMSEFKRLTQSYGGGYNLFLYEFFSKPLQDVRYHVVRAHVPAFIKLHLDEHFAASLGPRLRRFCEEMDCPYGDNFLNPHPHFFP